MDLAPEQFISCLVIETWRERNPKMYERLPFKSRFFMQHPVFLKDIRENAKKVNLAAAFSAKLKQMNVNIQIKGDTTAWKNAGTGVLLIGAHSNGLETILIHAVLGLLGRDDIKLTAKPYALAGQMYTALAGKDNPYLIDLMPVIMACGSKGGSCWDKFFRLIYAKDLLTKEKIKSLNKKSLQAAASYLEKGYAVNIFPTGKISSRISEAWRPGVGRIIMQMSVNARENTFVVPYIFANIKLWTIIYAVLLNSAGLRPVKLDIVFQVGTVAKVADIFADTYHTADSITELLHERFYQDFYQLV